MSITHPSQKTPIVHRSQLYTSPQTQVVEAANLCLLSDAPKIRNRETVLPIDSVPNPPLRRQYRCHWKPPPPNLLAAPAQRISSSIGASPPAAAGAAAPLAFSLLALLK